MDTLTIRPPSKKELERLPHSDHRLCYTCGTCITACPINIATAKLEPLKLLQMLNLGLYDELITLPEIWYCLLCGRCNNLCPMTVKPAELIRFLRNVAISEKKVPENFPEKFRELTGKFTRILWHAAARCKAKKEIDDILENWQDWLDTPVPNTTSLMAPRLPMPDGSAFRKEAANYLAIDTRLTVCFTCGQCSSSCPMFYERQVFDPQHLFRMAALGFREALLSSPSIWLCIDCQSCTQACPQGVKGHISIRRFKEMALSNGYVDPAFPERWQAFRARLYKRQIKEIDRLLEHTV